MKVSRENQINTDHIADFKIQTKPMQVTSELINDENLQVTTGN